MKRIFLLFTAMILTMGMSFAQVQISIMPKVGYNFVNVEKATGTPTYENSNGGTYLERWDKVNYGVISEIMLKSKGQWSIGGEISFNRLYYWEETYETYYGSDYRWGDVFTLGLGFVAKYHFTDLFYMKPAFSIESYTDGSGMNIGTALAAGMDFKISDRLSFPFELRTDEIFGNSLSFVVAVAFGLSANF